MKQVIFELVSSSDDNKLKSVDKKSISNAILESLTSDSVDIYFRILEQYMIAKRKRKMSANEVARKSGYPPTTIKRFENLQSIPTALTLFKILDSVGLTVSVG